MHRWSTLAVVSRLIRDRKTSPVEVTRGCLERIEELNPRLNAFITVIARQALNEAKKAEADIQNKRWRGPLHGVPVALKDFFDTAGIKTTGAFEHFRNRIPAKDAEVVSKLKEAGAVIVGKTNMHVLGTGTTSVDSCFGPVHNPWNLDFAAGGSSGGSAAAVAAGMCYATIDTDAIGSCRLPAACCGVTGFKPTFGLLSTKGILNGEAVDDRTARFIAAFGHTAITARTSEDVAIVLNALAAPRVTLSKLEPNSRPRIGVAKNYVATRKVRIAFERTVEALGELGYGTVDIEAPLTPGFDLGKIEQDRERINASLFTDIDILILPTMDAPPSIEEVQRSGNPQAISSSNTFFCNYYGLPAISVPCGFQNGLPLGFQIVGPQGSEGSVLSVAHSFQQTSKGRIRHPKLELLRTRHAC